MFRLLIRIARSLPNNSSIKFHLLYLRTNGGIRHDRQQRQQDSVEVELSLLAVPGLFNRSSVVGGAWAF